MSHAGHIGVHRFAGRLNAIVVVVVAHCGVEYAVVVVVIL